MPVGTSASGCDSILAQDEQLKRAGRDARTWMWVLRLNASCVPGSKAFASTPSPMGSVVTTFPVSALITAMSLFPQPTKSLRCCWSMAIPEGSSHARGASAM